MFNRNEIKVGFNEFTYSEIYKQICDVYPITPAKKIEKPWWKIMKTHYELFFHNRRREFTKKDPTIKYCPGIYDFTNYGYIVPAWQDFQFFVDDEGRIDLIQPLAMEKVNNVKSHSKEQVDTCPILDNSANDILKIVSPWLISTPAGTSLMMCKPFYHYSNDFDVCPGVLDSDIEFLLPNHEINIMLRFNVKNKVIHIKAGQPLVQLIPFKRTNWKLKSWQIDKSYKDKIIKNLIKTDNRFEKRATDKDSMRDFRQDDSNKKFE
jgi:hypothetical protein